MKKLFLAIIFTPLLLFFVGTASATLYTVDFTASGFTDYFNTWEVPQDTVSGSITYDVIGSAIDSVYGIDLTIDGYSYSINDILFSGSRFYTNVNGEGEALNNTRYNDFLIDFQYIIPDYNGNFPYARLFQLHYTVAGGGTRIIDGVPLAGDRGWYSTRTGTVAVGEFQESPVPEPATMMLFGIGLLGLSGVSRRKNC